MTSDIRKSSLTLNYIKLSRQVKRSQTDESKILLALPGDIPESTWVDILNTEETELIILGIREDLLDLAMNICYEKYMEKQKFAFTAHCAAEAWLQIIDWHFFRHDPGEEPSAYPPAAIPHRAESWLPDLIPDPSPKDTWCQHDQELVEEVEEEEICYCSSTLVTPEVEGSLVDRFDDEDEVFEGSCPCESNATEGSPCEGTCSEKTRDTRDSKAAASASCYSSHLGGIRKMDSSPLVPASSECGGGDSSRASGMSRSRKPKNIFSQSTSGRSKQTLPPLPPMDGSSKTRRTSS